MAKIDPTTDEISMQFLDNRHEIDEADRRFEEPILPNDPIQGPSNDSRVMHHQQSDPIDEVKFIFEMLKSKFILKNLSFFMHMDY